MHLGTYPVVALNNSTRFEFLSEGPNGTIKKVVIYQSMGGQVFNLAFGVWDEEKQRLLDLARSNNNDRDKILATVALTIFDFMHHHSEVSVFARGSTPSRTRLYQIGIKANWLEISQAFFVQGFTANVWEDFDSIKNYDAFIVSAQKKL